MKKINFVNGTTIDGASTFNQMQDNVEEVFNGKESMGSIVVEDIECKNLIYGFKAGYGFNTITSQYEVATMFSSTEPIEVELGQTYIFSHAVGHIGGAVHCLDSNGTFIETLNQDTVLSPFTITNPNCKKVVIVAWDPNNNAIVNETWMQLEKGTTATPYTPYKKFGYNSQESMGKIVVDDIECKNKFDIDTMVELIGYYRNFQNGDIYANPDFNGIKVPVEPNTTYAYSTDSTSQSNITFYDRNFNYLSGFFFEENLTTITTPYNCYYLCMAVQNDYTWIQIEEGNVVTNPVKFKEFSNKHIYSTQEHIVGVWTDGKPLYEKTIELPNGIENVTDIQGKPYLLTDLGITNVDTIFFKDPSYYTHGGFAIPFQYYDGDIYSIQVDKTYLRIICTYEPIALSKMVITLNYTKTTHTSSVSTMSLEE